MDTLESWSWICPNGKRYVRVGLTDGDEIHVFIRTDGVVEPWGGIRGGINYGTFFDASNPEADLSPELLAYVKGLQ